MSVKIWLPILLFSAGLAALVILNKVAIQDWWYLRSYEPTIQIEVMAKNASMTDKARDLFYLADPEIIPVSEAAEKCISIFNIGCFVEGPKIYVVDINGDTYVEDDLHIVTAAHEMLHMGYQRLSPGQQNEIDRLIQKELDKPINQAVFAAVDLYDDPFIRADEAHSIVGTEAAVIDPLLETHYAQFFKNRAIVTTAHENSKSLLNQ